MDIQTHAVGDAYQTFLESKLAIAPKRGLDVKGFRVHSLLFPFQRDIVKWLIRQGRGAVFADTGLGKTFIQLEWARWISNQTKKPVLIVAPLSVARQTVREARKIDLGIHYTRSGGDLAAGINITNYEMLEHFDPSVFGGVGLDESSILKSLDGATKAKLIELFGGIPYRACFTATPAPNDLTELGNHAEFLGICTRREMESMFFIHANKIEETVIGEHVIRKKQSNDKGQEWRLKHHARQPFYRWLASWAMSIRKPSDLGYSDDGYNLPPLCIEPLFIGVDYAPEGQLFFTGLKGIADRSNIRKITLAERVQTAAALVNQSDVQWNVWCGLNDEATAMTAAIPDAVEVRGSDSPETKAERIESFQDGKTRVLVTKPRIAGFGMNFQNAHNMVFVGLNDSWEWYYQCIRRQYRFGQKEQVNCYIVLSELEREIYENVMQKEQMARRMSEALVQNARRFEKENLQ